MSSSSPTNKTCHFNTIKSAMEIFQKASHHDKYLLADEDEEHKPATILRSPTPPTQATRPVKVLEKNAPYETISPTAYWPKFPTNEAINLFATSPLKAEGRHIIYDLTDENGNVDESKRELHFTFKGIGVEELKQSIKEETGMDDIVVCSRNPLNGKLYPLKLHLPPNNVTMHVVVVPSTAEGTGTKATSCITLEAIQQMSPEERIENMDFQHVWLWHSSDLFMDLSRSCLNRHCDCRAIESFAGHLGALASRAKVSFASAGCGPPLLIGEFWSFVGRGVLSHEDALMGSWLWLVLMGGCCLALSLMDRDEGAAWHCRLGWCMEAFC
ncbi:hypothetical protein Patl1_22091 [Pistacia atlantica]|uniref:Uncharacterized protein n=1 Tax=Pistacia atlantica TaxID=434234 RepID=A0ACC1BNV1_9ROSI|nr:hypothetical protein Patl1_22091 [Pistacia atlantica]